MERASMDPKREVYFGSFFLGALLSNIVRKKWKLVIALNLAGNPLTNPAYQGISFLPYLWGSCIKLRGDKSLAYTRNSLAHKPNYDLSQVFFFREIRHVFFLSSFLGRWKERD